MVELAGGLAVLGIILAVIALVGIVVAIVWAVVRCAVARRRAEASQAKEGLLNKDCAICKGPLAVAGGERCRRLRACGHVYHADCVDPWLKRKKICPLCRAIVDVPRTDIVDAMV